MKCLPCLTNAGNKHPPGEAGCSREGSSSRRGHHAADENRLDWLRALVQENVAQTLWRAWQRSKNLRSLAGTDLELLLLTQEADVVASFMRHGAPRLYVLLLVESLRFHAAAQLSPEGVAKLSRSLTQ